MRANLTRGREAYQSARLHFCWSLPRTKISKDRHWWRECTWCALTRSNASVAAAIQRPPNDFSITFAQNCVIRSNYTQACMLWVGVERV